MLTGSASFKFKGNHLVICEKQFSQKNASKELLTRKRCNNTIIDSEPIFTSEK
jgi:hypothetical protein